MIKRKLLTLLMALSTINLMAATTFNYSTSVEDQTIDGITVQLKKGQGQNDPAVANSTVRLYANNVITIQGKDIKKISLTFTKNSSKTYASMSVDVGTLTSGGNSTSINDAKTDTWTGSANMVNFTIGSTGQRVLKTIIVETGTGSGGGGGSSEGKNNVITYKATRAIVEVEAYLYGGLHIDAFNVPISSHTFSNGVGIITFAGEVTSIGDYAFTGTSYMTSITIPSSVTSIGRYAFMDCYDLNAITIPSSVISIGQCAFEGCSALTKTNYTGTIADWCKIKFGENFSVSYDNRCTANPIQLSNNFYINEVEIRNLVIPNSVTKIEDCAFSGYSRLTSVTIPNSVTSIGDCAFHSCSGLTSVTIPSSVTSIGAHAFHSCSGLTSVTIPSSVTSIGDYAFYNCEKLVSIILKNENIKYKGNYIFGITNRPTLYVACALVNVYKKDVTAALLGIDKDDDYYKGFTIESYESGCTGHEKVYYVSLFPNSHGTCSGTGYYKEGEQITIKAIPEQGYYFKSWTYDKGFGSTQLSTNSTYTFNSSSNAFATNPNKTEGIIGIANITANFEQGSAPSSRAQVSLPYSEAFTSTQGNFTIQDVSLPSGFSSIWILDGAGKYGMVACASKSATSLYASESWLISPFIEIPANSSCTLSFNHTAKFFSNKTKEMSLWISTNYQNGKPATGTWKQFTIPNYPTGNDWNFVKSGDIDLSQYAGQTITIAFKYVSTTSSAPKWEIKDFSVSSQYTDIPQIHWDRETPRKILYDGQLFILNSAGIFNLQGQKIK